MPLIDIACTGAAPHTVEVNRPIADWPSTPACPICGAATFQIFSAPVSPHAIDPIVVYKAPDGSYRVPGEADGISARKYDALGYTKVECRSAADVRRVEAAMTREQRTRAEQSVERKAMASERRESEQRAALRQVMGTMSAFGRDVAREAMRRNDAKPKDYAQDPGVHVEALSYDRGNREGARDSAGRKRRD